MLKLFRHKNVVKMVLWGILLLIMPAFVFWGTGSLSGSRKRSAYVGKIDGRKVSFDEFANSVIGARCQLFLRYYDDPKVLSDLLNNKPLIGMAAWDRMIMLREAGKRNIKVSDKAVITYIRSLPIFLKGDKFDEKFYGYLLKNYMGLAPRKFEELMRERIAINILNDTLTSGIKATDEEIIDLYKKEHQKFKISYLLFPSSDFLDKVKVDDREAVDYYEKYREGFLRLGEKDDLNQAAGTANLDKPRELARRVLASAKARDMALEHAEKERERIAELMKKDGIGFEKAAAKLGIEAKETPVFSRPDRLEGIGAAAAIADAAMVLEKDEISKPVATEKGAVIFRTIEVGEYDEEGLKKERDGYSKRILNEKKERFLATWLRERERKASLEIDLNDYEKYYG